MTATLSEARIRRGRGRRPVLVLGRDPVLRWTLARSVRRLGLPAATARGCAEAVDWMTGARPSLVLIDTAVPGWLDLLFTLRAAFTPPVPVVLTGPRGRPGVQARTLPLCFHAPEPTSPRAIAALVATIAGRVGARFRRPSSDK
jgi:CheY-like chemotaxis protein